MPQIITWALYDSLNDLFIFNYCDIICNKEFPSVISTFGIILQSVIYGCHLIL